MLSSTSVSMTPCATCEGRVPSRRTTPQPKCRVPGSMPITIMSARAVPCVGKDFARVQQPLGIERVLQPELQVDELAGLLEVQIGHFHDADAVLAGERAAHRDHVAKQ